MVIAMKTKNIARVTSCFIIISSLSLQDFVNILP
jgi:hypothetical protein